MRLMQRLVREQKRTLVMVTHDRSQAEYADRVLEIIDGKKFVHITEKSGGKGWKMREHRKDDVERNRIGNFDAWCLCCLCLLRSWHLQRKKSESGSQVSKRELAYIQISVGDGQETPVFKAGRRYPSFGSM